MKRAVLVVLLSSAVAQAHELTPALLSLVERGDGLYDVTWRVPRDEAPRYLITPVLPAEAEVVGGKTRDADGNAQTERWVVRLPRGIGAVHLDAPPGTRTDALIRVVRRDGRVLHGRLAPDGTPFVVPPDPTWRSVAGTYLRLGVEHILLGFDHLLFVLGLLLLARSTGALVRTITAFTAAHSVTLALATLGVLHVPAAPVEATIALSIVFVAREALAPGPSTRPWVVALLFGLLHGLGFASALTQVGLPRGEVPLALATFNVGVEVGQLAFVAVVLVPLRLLRAERLSGTPRRVLAYGIGALAAALCLSRILSLA